MRAIPALLFLLAATPTALSAQLHPDPRDLPDIRPPVLVPQTSSRTTEVLVGAAEGLVVGTAGANGVQACSLLTANGRSGALVSGVLGATWGGVRGFLGLRRRPGRIRTDTRDGRFDPQRELPVMARVGTECPGGDGRFRGSGVPGFGASRPGGA